MSKQTTPANAYLPSRNLTYYPIEPKKTNQEQSAPRQSTRIDKHREKEVDVLRKAYEELKEREEIYIDKLMKLQEGLENQHSQFIKLQELYTDLFQSYKQKESEIIELEMKYRESDRYREQERDTEKPKQSFRFNDSRMKEYSFRQKEWSSKEEQWQLKERQWMGKQKEWSQKQKQMNEYIETLRKKAALSAQNYERAVQELSISKTKEKTSTNRALTEKTMNEVQEWQKQIDTERENRLKFQYQNQFLKNRITDLETQREQLEKILAHKQKEINKLRQEKIRIHRQSSEKNIQRSPAKTIKKSPIKVEEASIESQKERRIDLSESDAHASSVEAAKQKYFSFSRQRHNDSMDSELPNFPPELEIDSLITEHKK